MKNEIKELKKQWCGETPKIAKIIRNIAASISCTLPTVWISFSSMGISLPSWFEQSFGYISVISLLITGFAGTKETKEAKEKRMNNNE